VYGLETVSLRYFNVYGPRRTLQRLLRCALAVHEGVLERTRPAIFGDGEQSRDFTYVEDVAT